jgi:hypothetical protein
MALRHIKARYLALNPGGHGFDKDTMRFFGTRVGKSCYADNGDTLFITSEQPPSGPRGWAVRRMNCDTGDITGDVREFDSYAKAARAMEQRKHFPREE